VPDFGAFITSAKSTEFNALTQTVSPKAKKVSFNSALKTNDGLLAHELSTCYSIPYSEALQEIKSQVNSMKLQLNNDKQLDYGSLGTFYAGKEGQILFVAKQQTNLEISSYGLPALKLKASQEYSAPKEDVSLSTVSETIEKPTPSLYQKEKPENKGERVQEKRQEQKQKRKAPLLSGIKILNTIGFLFLLATVFAVLNQEMGLVGPVVKQEASILDSPKFETTLAESSTKAQTSESIEDVISKISAKHARPTFEILLDGTYTYVEVDKIKGEIQNKFTQIEIIELENGNYSLMFMSFSNEELAQEYKSLIERSLKRPITLRVNKHASTTSN
jgi:hypothetical protein